MAKIAVVFGGAGFIGMHLLKALAESGQYDHLMSVDLREPRMAIPGVEHVRRDIREPIPSGLCPGVTEIYNFAAVHTTPGHEDWEYYWTNVLGATHVCRYASECAVDTVVFTSSISVYGPSEELKNEDSTPEPESAYGKSKLCAEKIHQLWQAERPETRRLVIVRPAVIYGHLEGGNFTRLAGLLRKNRFFYPGRKDTIKACGYVGDLIESMRFVLDRGTPVTTYNFGHVRRYSSEEICDAFSAVAGYPRARRVLPLPVILSAAWIFEMLGRLGLKTSINRARVLKLNRSTNIEPKRLVEMGFPFRYDLPRSLAHWRETSPNREFV